MEAMALRSRSFRREGHTNAPQAPFSTAPGTGEGGGVWLTFAGSCRDELVMGRGGGSWGDVARKLKPTRLRVGRRVYFRTLQVKDALALDGSAQGALAR